MAETLSLIDNNIIVTQEAINRENPGGKSTESLAPVDKSPFRRIEFHLARKPFTGFTKGGGDGSFQLETLNPTSTSLNNTHGNQQNIGLDSVGCGSSGKKRDASEIGNGKDPELSFGITFRRIGAGLENLGNTCFLNSVLQCLTYTEPLAAYLQSGKHQITCQKAGFCALCAIQKHVSRALESSGRSLAPKDLVSNLRCISRTFRNSRQEDAHEYMVNLLESMHKCCIPTGVPSESQNAYDKSLVHKIFGGSLRSQVKCMQCNYCSDKFDPFLDLSLEILRADTLYKAFANFTAKEQLDGGAKQYQCQQCKQKVKALKQLTIHKAPNVLTVHLKRFGSHMSGQKIDKKIQFDSTLDLKPFVTGPYDEDLKYTLYGVLVHAGWSTHSGHYYCFVRTSSGMWYSLDDNRVYQVSEKKVFEQKAYMLFYFKDKKSFPSRKTADSVHQKETQMKTSVSNGSTNGQQSLANGFSPNLPKKTEIKTVLSNGSLSGHKSLVNVGTMRNGLSPNAQKETEIKTILSNGSSNGHKSSVTAGAVRNGLGLNAPKETEIRTILSNVSSNGHKSLVTVGTMRNGSSTGAPKETEIKTILSNGSSNGHKSLVTVGTMRNGSSTGAPKETEIKTILSNGSSNGHKSLVTVGTMRNGSSTGAPEPKEKNENLVSKSSESSLKSKNGDLSVPTVILGNSASKTDKGDSVKEVGGGDAQKVVVTAMAETSDLPKIGSMTKKKNLDQKTKKVKKILKCKAISMKFSANIFMGTSLKKKKKHKQSRKIKNLAQENSVNEGPSSSEKVKAQEVVKAENGFKERIKKDGAVLATNDLNGGQLNNLDSCRDASVQKDLAHLLTSGLEDRIVPRWDEESIPAHRRETKRDLTIGYIGDEWDEEYDKGKRKKIRISKTEFDGKNPFQDIANERLKPEKPNLSKRPSSTINRKTNHFKKPRYGNRPFRL